MLIRIVLPLILGVLVIIGAATVSGVFIPKLHGVARWRDAPIPATVRIERYDRDSLFIMYEPRQSLREVGPWFLQTWKSDGWKLLREEYRSGYGGHAIYIFQKGSKGYEVYIPFDFPGEWVTLVIIEHLRD